ncbi:hypothetical protein ACFL0V_06865 [Nanoarchaeota archaeon]
MLGTRSEEYSSLDPLGADLSVQDMSAYGSKQDAYAWKAAMQAGVRDTMDVDDGPDEEEFRKIAFILEDGPHNLITAVRGATILDANPGAARFVEPGTSLVDLLRYEH